MSREYLNDLELKKKEIRDQYKKSLLSKKETAREIGISVASLDRLRRKGEITSCKVLGQVKITIDELSRFLISW